MDILTSTQFTEGKYAKQIPLSACLNLVYGSVQSDWKNLGPRSETENPKNMLVFFSRNILFLGSQRALSSYCRFRKEDEVYGGYLLEQEPSRRSQQ